MLQYLRLIATYTKDAAMPTDPSDTARVMTADEQRDRNLETPDGFTRMVDDSRYRGETWVVATDPDLGDDDALRAGPLAGDVDKAANQREYDRCNADYREETLSDLMGDLGGW